MANNHPARSPAQVTFSYLVDSVRTVQINGFNLRRLYINNGTTVVTERFGSNGLLFNFPNYETGSCDGDYFHEFLCYTDLSFGTKQFSAKPCNFSNSTGITNINQSNNKIQVYPNPCSDKINIEIQTSTKKDNYEILFVDLLGQKMDFSKINLNENNSFELDISSFKTGIYFLQVSQNNKLLTRQKLIKK